MLRRTALEWGNLVMMHEWFFLDHTKYDRPANADSAWSLWQKTERFQGSRPAQENLSWRSKTSFLSRRKHR